MMLLFVLPEVRASLPSPKDFVTSARLLHRQLQQVSPVSNAEYLPIDGGSFVEQSLNLAQPPTSLTSSIITSPLSHRTSWCLSASCLPLSGFYRAYLLCIPRGVPHGGPRACPASTSNRSTHQALSFFDMKCRDCSTHHVILRS